MKKCRCRYSVRRLLLVVALLCIALGFLSIELRRAHRQRQAVLAVERRGGVVEFDFWDAEGEASEIRQWARRLIGRHLFSRVVRINFYSSAVMQGRAVSIGDLRVPLSDDDLLLLAAFPELESLGLSDTEITNRAIDHLLEFRKLEVLALQRTDIDDGCVDRLSKMKQLRWLFVDQTSVTKEGAQRLGKALRGTHVVHVPGDENWNESKEQ